MKRGSGIWAPVESDVMSDLVDPVGSAWTDMLTMPWARAVAGIVILCILIAFGFYVVSSFRDYAGNTRRGPYFADSNLKEMLRRGDISQAEFRTIQSKSHGASIVTGQTYFPSDQTSLNSSAKLDTGDASLVDETKRVNSFLPPSEPNEGN